MIFLEKIIKIKEIINILINDEIYFRLSIIYTVLLLQNTILIIYFVFGDRKVFHNSGVLSVYCIVYLLRLMIIFFGQSFQEGDCGHNDNKQSLYYYHIH